MAQLLGDRADDLDIDRLGQARQLFERVLHIPGVAVFVDGDQESMFDWPAGGHAVVGNGTYLVNVNANNANGKYTWRDCYPQ